MRTTLQGLLASEGPVIADGGMGTMLIALGLERGAPPEVWNVERPDAVRLVHQSYIEAGAQIILTNSFGGNRLRLGMHGLSERAAELNTAAARLARAEADSAERPVVVGGSMGPTGRMVAPMGDLDYDEAVSVFEEQARTLAEGGTDVCWIETMSDLEEVRAAVEGCRKGAPDLPIVSTMSFDTHGRTMMGVTPEKALEALREFDVVALGANCGKGPDELESAVAKMRAADPTMTLIAKANAGVPHLESGVAVYDATPDAMGEHAARVHGLGARIIGACCGSTPDHIRAIAYALGK
ncbi:MAG TPA: betaine--homocysteine S-methyltransferase [Aggregatilineaceae bacterium]|nr:betaine--homocysteine S-methyltransferase [Aggregatilineaceae bacterium]